MLAHASGTPGLGGVSPFPVMPVPFHLLHRQPVESREAVDCLDKLHTRAGQPAFERSQA